MLQGNRLAMPRPNRKPKPTASGNGKTEKKGRVRATQRFGAILRVIIFIANSIVWTAAIAALVGGMMVGFSNGTFSMDAPEDDHYAEGDTRWRDILITTPATLLVYYGILMIIVTTFGCFSASGAQRACNITYVIAIVLLIIFDLAFGLRVFFDKFAMARFMSKMEVAMDQYGTKDGSSIGVLPMTPKNYWDYLQKVGKCCGMTKYQDWRNTKIASPENEYRIPDSCCTKDYDHKNCGWRVWAHFDGDYNHFRKDMLKRVGCVTIFPDELTTGYENVAYITILLGVLLIICLILTIVLLVFIFLRKYKAHQGPEYKQHHQHDDPETPVIWSNRGRRDAIHLPLPADDLNYKVNEPVYFTPEMLKREQEKPRSDYEPDAYDHDARSPSERIPFSKKPENENRPTTGAAGRAFVNKSAEKIFHNREFGKESKTDLLTADRARTAEMARSPSPVEKNNKIKNVKSI